MDILNKTRMFAYDHFYLLEISPNYKEQLVEKCSEFISTINRELKSYVETLTRPESEYKVKFFEQ